MARKRASDASINVEDLDKLARALREMDKETAKKLRLTNKSVASGEADRARSAAFALGGVAAHVAPSIKAAAGAQFAGIAGGGPSQPAFGGAEFGSVNYRQFQPFRGSGPGAGYFVYPTIRRDLPDIETKYLEAIGDLIKEVGLG